LGAPETGPDNPAGRLGGVGIRGDGGWFDTVYGIEEIG